MFAAVHYLFEGLFISLQQILKRYFSGTSENDSCTLYSDRTLINRRNVKADPKTAYRADRDLFVLVVQSRVIAAAIELLGFEDKSSHPTKYPLPEGIEAQSKESKRHYLHKAAAIIVDTLVIEDSLHDLFNKIAASQEEEDRTNQQPQNYDGRYPCRIEGCKQSFKYDGTSRRKHELTHNQPSESSDTQNDPCKKEAKNKDDIYSYNCALLEDGLFFLNFLDDVAEGDGNRIMRQYKYILLSFRADGQQSTKYALECLYQTFLVNALLSHRDAERFVWNRSVNTFGGVGKNIGLDLDMEHGNRFVKQAIKNLWPNITERAVERICHAERGMRKVKQKC